MVRPERVRIERRDPGEPPSASRRSSPEIIFRGPILRSSSKTDEGDDRSSHIGPRTTRSTGCRPG